MKKMYKQVKTGEIVYTDTLASGIVVVVVVQY